MSNTDKTRRMLMSSMSKTRAHVRKSPVSTEPTSQKLTTRKKTVRKDASIKKASTQKASIGRSMVKPQPVIGLYQSRGRIWPD